MLAELLKGRTDFSVDCITFSKSCTIGTHNPSCCSFPLFPQLILAEYLVYVVTRVEITVGVL